MVVAATVTTKLVFTRVATQTFGAGPFAVSATSNSAAPITYSVVSGPATLSGNVVSITGAGKVTLQASQAAVTGYTAATATTSFTVSPAPPGLSFITLPAKFEIGAATTVSTSANSPGAITYSVERGPATISGSTVTFTGKGTVTIEASQAATTDYLAGTATVRFTVTK
jgi:hypothetical protein